MLSLMHMIRIRNFEPGDAKIIFQWRNDPYIVNLGSLKKEVTWNEHMVWFNFTLKATSRRAFITEIEGKPAGQIRFDKETEDSCLISIYLIREYSGKGFGLEIMKLGCAKIFQ